MNNTLTKPSHAQHTIKRYQGYGLVGGAAFGVLMGLLLSGPRFYEWPVPLTLVVVAACTAFGSLVGWGFMALFLGALAGPAVAEDEISEEDGKARAAQGSDFVDPS
jgi:hypothetical protein